MIKLFRLLVKYDVYIICTVLIVLSSISFLYFFQDGKHLINGDAVSRLNISRKIFDNLTPGFAQLGNVWLPLPHVLMLLFTWNKELWQTGIAAAIISMTSFVLGGVYLYKTGKIIFGSLIASLFSLLVYALNINILYFQTTAMSEQIFITFLIFSIFNLTMWIQDRRKLINLIFAGASICGLTLIRYEGLAVLGVSVIIVAFYSWRKDKSFRIIEGKTILFFVIAAFGFGLWTLYLTVIFNDPLYWKNVYVAQETRITSGGGVITGYAYNLSYLQSGWKYFTSVVWMNGIIPVIISIIALPMLAWKSFKEKSYVFLSILLPFSIFLFMILSLQRNTPIDQPILSISNIISDTAQKFPEFNIRYGLIVIPMISLLVGYMYNLRSYALKILLILIMCVQIYSYFYPKYSVIYQVPINIEGNITQGSPKEKAMVNWMRTNYSGGLIMISALKHDPQMFQMGLDYKSYIHEGTGDYWDESIKNPQLYATYVIYDSWNNSDQVTKYLLNSSKIDRYFNKVYENNGLYIFKIKTSPYHKL